jgi:WS/DGAT/MGAT family acyltransferase
MIRLTADDLLLLWPDEAWPQEIGALGVLDGSRLIGSDGRFRIEVVKAAIQARLHLVPRFRQVLYVPRRGLGPPLWVHAPEFDLDQHVKVASLAAPSDEVQLLHTIEELRQHRLDRSRPLWEMWFIPGLAENRVGVFIRIHHVIADGMAGIATVGAFLDSQPDAGSASAPPWNPAPLPTAHELFVDNLRQRAAGLRRGVASLRHARTALRQLRAGWSMMRGLFTLHPTPGTSLDRTVGPGRRFALIRSRLEAVKRVAHDHHATVNDVLLSVIAGGVRKLRQSRKEPVDDVVLPTYVPVTLRRVSREQNRGNLISQMVVRLPIGESDRDQRLQQIAAETTEQKAKGHPPLGTVIGSSFARWALLKLLGRHPVSVTTADLPGPPRTAYLAGARLVEVFPVLPLIGNVSLGVGALSYDGQFNIMVVGDRDAVPDLAVFAEGVREELQALERALRGPER